MATTTNETKNSASEEVKVDLLEDDDEFEEFVIDDEPEKNEVVNETHQWEDDWDDDDVNVYFSMQLRKELETKAEKN
ncbi:hypothetical protein Dimus_023844 [Dionaea muscipula]